MELTKLLNLVSRPDKRFEILIGLLLLTIPLGQFAITNFILLAILLNAFISLKPADWKAALVNPVFYWPALFMAYFAASLFWSEHLEDGFAQVQTKSTILLAPLILGASQRFISQKAFKNWQFCFVAGSVLVMLLAFIIAANKAWLAGSWYMITPSGEAGSHFLKYKMLAAPFMHPGYLATFVGVALLLVIAQLFRARGKRKLGWIMALIFLCFSIFMLNGRMNVLALIIVLAVGALVYAIQAGATRWLLIPFFALILLAVVFLRGSEVTKARYLQIPDFNYDISADAESFNSATYRLAEWSCALDVIKDKTIFGVGVGDNRLALQESYRRNKFYVGLENKFNAHNQYLEISIATGLVGLFFFLIWILNYFKIALQSRDYVFLATWAFFLLCMLTESMLERAWMTVFCATYFPLHLLCLQQEKSNRNAGYTRI